MNELKVSGLIVSVFKVFSLFIFQPFKDQINENKEACYPKQTI